MVSEIRKSINSILFERMTSPFYGAFLVAWSIWNWRILYLTIFVSEDRIIGNKLTFINENYINTVDMLWAPLMYSILLLTFGQILSNASYWLSLHMKKWKLNKRNLIEGKQLLTLEQSVQLRVEAQMLQERFERVINEKNIENDLLKRQKDELNKVISSNTQPSHNPYASSTVGDAEYEEFKQSGKAYQAFFQVATFLNEHGKFPKKFDEEIEDYYIINHIIETKPNSKDSYRLSFKGGHFYKKMFNERFSENQKLASAPPIARVRGD